METAGELTACHYPRLPNHLSNRKFWGSIQTRKFLTQVFEKLGFGCSNKSRYGQGDPPLGFDSTVCPWELFLGSNPPDKEILSKIHDHAGVVRPWSEILWLQLKSMYVARYGADDEYPM